MKTHLNIDLPYRIFTQYLTFYKKIKICHIILAKSLYKNNVLISNEASSCQCDMTNTLCNITLMQHQALARIL